MCRQCDDRPDQSDCGPATEPYWPEITMVDTALLARLQRDHDILEILERDYARNGQGPSLRRVIGDLLDSGLDLDSFPSLRTACAALSRPRPALAARKAL